MVDFDGPILKPLILCVDGQDLMGEPIVLPVPAITEVACLLARDIGNDAAADFISSLADTELILEAPVAEDY